MSSKVFLYPLDSVPLKISMPAERENVCAFEYKSLFFYNLSISCPGFHMFTPVVLSCLCYIAHQRQSNSETNSWGNGCIGRSSHLLKRASWDANSVGEKTWRAWKGVAECCGKRITMNRRNENFSSWAHVVHTIAIGSIRNDNSNDYENTTNQWFDWLILIGAARAARFLVQFFDVVCQTTWDFRSWGSDDNAKPQQ